MFYVKFGFHMIRDSWILDILHPSHECSFIYEKSSAILEYLDKRTNQFNLFYFLIFQVLEHTFPLKVPQCKTWDIKEWTLYINNTRKKMSVTRLWNWRWKEIFYLQMNDIILHMSLVYCFSWGIRGIKPFHALFKSEKMF